ncbi:hypothetical protein AWZ03_015263, partial [Drosophila navojoa]
MSESQGALSRNQLQKPKPKSKSKSISKSNRKPKRNQQANPSWMRGSTVIRPALGRHNRGAAVAGFGLLFGLLLLLQLLAATQSTPSPSTMPQKR